VLGPIALALLGFGRLKLVRDIIVYDWRVPTNTVVILMTGMQIGALPLTPSHKGRDNRPSPSMGEGEGGCPSSPKA